MQQGLAVCVTGVGGGGVGEQIVKALRCAGTPYHIWGTDMVPNSAGFALVHSHATLPSAQHPEYLTNLLRLCHTQHIRAVLPGSEAELLRLSLHRDELAAEGIFLPIADHSLLQCCLDKAALFEKLIAKDIDTPRQCRVQFLDDLQQAPRYPLIFKPAVGGGGSADVFIVQDADEAIFFAQYLLRIHPAFLAQEYVGTPEDEYTVGVLMDMDGLLVHSMALHRTLRPALSRRLRVPNRTGRQELGPMLVVSSGISQGHMGLFPHICAQCRDMAYTLGCCGPFNFQGRIVDGRFMLFEINPRFSGTTSMRAMAGLNEPDLLIRKHVLGEEIPRDFPVRELNIQRRLEEVVMADNDTELL